MVSDGQRRRVQLAVGLLRPFKVRAGRCQGGAFGGMLFGVNGLLLFIITAVYSSCILTLAVFSSNTLT